VSWQVVSKRISSFYTWPLPYSTSLFGYTTTKELSFGVSLVNKFLAVAYIMGMNLLYFRVRIPFGHFFKYQPDHCYCVQHYFSPGDTHDWIYTPGGVWVLDQYLPPLIKLHYGRQGAFRCRSVHTRSIRFVCRLQLFFDYMQLKYEGQRSDWKRSKQNCHS